MEEIFFHCQSNQNKEEKCNYNKYCDSRNDIFLFIFCDVHIYMLFVVFCGVFIIFHFLIYIVIVECKLFVFLCILLIHDMLVK